MRTVFIIPDELWEKAKTRALRDRVSLAEIIRRALKEYLRKEASPKGKKK
jgi:hypothetical protein